MNGLHKRDAALQVGAESRMSSAVLGLGTVADAIGEGSLEPIEVGADDVYALIGDESCQVLAHTSPHDACLAVVHREALLVQNRGGVNREPLHASLEGFAAGKREIVRVARVE